MPKKYFQGTPLDIATAGELSTDPLTKATRGFLVPDISDITLGGEAGVVFSMGWTTTGGLVTGGLATIGKLVSHISNGGIVIGGNANEEHILGVVIPARKKVRQRNNPVTFSYTPPDAEDLQTPMDFWKKIEKALEKKQPQIYTFKASGGIYLRSANRRNLVVCLRQPIEQDKPSDWLYSVTHAGSSNILVPDYPMNSISKAEQISLEDFLLLNNGLNSGKVNVKTGDHLRHTIKPKKPSSSIKGGAKVTVSNPLMKRIKEEDALILGESYSSESISDSELEEQIILNLI